MNDTWKAFIKDMRKRIFHFYKRRTLRIVTNGMGKVEITDDKIVCYVNNDILRRKYEKNKSEMVFYGVDSFEPSLLHTYSIDKPVYYIIENMKFDHGLKFLARNNTCIVFRNCIFERFVNIPWADQVIFENNLYHDRFPIYYPDKKCFFTVSLKNLTFINDHFTNSCVDHHPTRFGIKADVWNLNVDHSQFGDDVGEIDIKTKKMNMKNSSFDCYNMIIQSNILNICNSNIKAKEGIIIENKNYDFNGFVDSPLVIYNGVSFINSNSSIISLDQDVVSLQRSREKVLDQWKMLRDCCNQISFQRIHDYQEKLNQESIQKIMK